MQCVPVQPLSQLEARTLMTARGVSEEDAASLARATHGHPLALKLAVTASRERPPRSWPREPVLQHAIDGLSRMFLADVDDPISRRVLEGAVVLRRATVSLLQALFPELASQDAYERLHRLPFVDGVDDGLIIHDAVRHPLARSLHASNPSRYRDPVTAQWCSHLQQNPMAPGEIALFCRRWLSLHEGDSPSAIQATVLLDLKRSYMELRPKLRRVYLTAFDLGAYSEVAQRLGFEVLAGREVELDGLCYPSAVLDFGPASVDGWLADLAAAELGVQRNPALLDVEARQLLLAEGAVGLTPLEFGIMRYLVEHPGKAVSRSELLQHVWGTRYQGGSNVVDAVVRTLRRKLGSQFARVETVTGVGYRLRSSAVCSSRPTTTSRPGS